MLKSFQIGGVAAILAVVALGYWHYVSLVGDLNEATAEKARLSIQLDTVIDVAKNNAKAVERADADRKAAVDALEFVQAGLYVNSKTSRLATSAIDNATAAEDGDVAPLMEALRKSRFGGAK